MQMYPITVQSEIHHQIQEQVLNQKLSSTTEKIVRLNPNLLLGETNLFDYDPASHALILTPSFQSLLSLLVKIGELDPKALEADSLQGLNSILQQSQGTAGGLLRKPGTERYHMEDHHFLKKHSKDFDTLFQQLGFVAQKSIDCEMTVDHCIIFGALTGRMESRIRETLFYLQNNLKVAGHIFLLGSSRTLTPGEIDHLTTKLEKLDEPQRDHWKEVFSDPEQSTEANAFAFLWDCIVPEETQALYGKKVVGIKSTQIGNSYNGQSGHRATTETTIEDWMSFYNADEPQAIFALAEQPYVRLADQLRLTVLSKGKKASLEELIGRIKCTTFHFGFPEPSSKPLISVVLDEIGRNVYRTVDTLKYLENLEALD